MDTFFPGQRLMSRRWRCSRSFFFSCDHRDQQRLRTGETVNRHGDVSREQELPCDVNKLLIDGFYFMFTKGETVTDKNQTSH